MCIRDRGSTSLAYAQQTEKPNFVLFIADDCSHYDLGCYGSVDSKTPNIDRFATQGVRFTQAYQAVPMSSPTRDVYKRQVLPARLMRLTCSTPAGSLRVGKINSCGASARQLIS